MESLPSTRSINSGQCRSHCSALSCGAVQVAILQMSEMAAEMMMMRGHSGKSCSTNASPYDNAAHAVHSKINDRAISHLFVSST